MTSLNENTYPYPDIRKELFKHESDTVRENIKGSSVYGFQMDENNVDELVSAAYWLGFKTAKKWYCKDE
jgi:hypothetical protein